MMHPAAFSFMVKSAAFACRWGALQQDRNRLGRSAPLTGQLPS